MLNLICLALADKLQNHIWNYKNSVILPNLCATYFYNERCLRQYTKVYVRLPLAH